MTRVLAGAGQWFDAERRIANDPAVWKCCESARSAADRDQRRDRMAKRDGRRPGMRNGCTCGIRRKGREPGAAERRHTSNDTQDGKDDKKLDQRDGSAADLAEDHTPGRTL
jgi:hypothetical protein